MSFHGVRVCWALEPKVLFTTVRTHDHGLSWPKTVPCNQEVKGTSGKGHMHSRRLELFFWHRAKASSHTGNHKCPSFHLHYFVNVNCQGALSWPFSPWITYDTPRKIWVQARMCFVCTECSPHLAYESSQNHCKVLLHLRLMKPCSPFQASEINSCLIYRGKKGHSNTKTSRKFIFLTSPPKNTHKKSLST